MKKKTSSRPWVLMNPGPVNVTDRVRQALLKPDLCHRETEFSELLSGIRKKILKLFGIESTHQAALFTGSGTAALEAMLGSFCEENKKILVLSNGVYGDRIKNILELHDTPVDVLKADIGDFPSIEKIEVMLKNDETIHGLAMVHHETSSGMLNPVDGVAALAKKYKKTFLVDAISSLGAEKIDFKKNGIGFLAGSSGKCLHGYPGISFVIVSNEEAKKLNGKKPRSLYLNLKQMLDYGKKNDTPFTPAVQLFYALDTALDELKEERLENRIENYRLRSQKLEKGFMDCGLHFLIEKEYRSHVLTSLWVPEGLTYKILHEKLKKKGFVIYAGQSELAGKIFRVSNLGDMKDSDIDRFLKVLKQILNAQAKPEKTAV